MGECDELLVDNATGYVFHLEYYPSSAWQVTIRRSGVFMKSIVGYLTREDILEAAQVWAKAHKEKHPNG